MSKVKVGFVSLHNPLFFAKTNFKDKIDVRTSKSGTGLPIEMEYDRGAQELTLTCGERQTFIPATNIISYEPIEKLAPVVQPVSHAGANPKVNAQVSGPHDHVFAGQGQGQTGAGKRVK